MRSKHFFSSGLVFTWQVSKLSLAGGRLACLKTNGKKCRTVGSGSRSSRGHLLLVYRRVSRGGTHRGRLEVGRASWTSAPRRLSTRTHTAVYTTHLRGLGPVQSRGWWQNALELGWRDGSVVKSTDCSSRGPEFKSQQPHGGSQPSEMRSDALFWCV